LPEPAACRYLDKKTFTSKTEKKYNPRQIILSARSLLKFILSLKYYSFACE
jgi:hypothetical protein